MKKFDTIYSEKSIKKYDKGEKKPHVYVIARAAYDDFK